MRRLFARFAEVYGAQKCAAMWHDVGMDAVARTWSDALGRFDAQVLAAAARELPERESSWPPTLPEFVGLCQRHVDRPGYRIALPPPARTDEDRARGREQMAAIRALAASLRTPPGRQVPPAPPAPACTCWQGSVRMPTLCPACSRYAADRARSDMLRDGTAQRMADEAAS